MTETNQEGEDIAGASNTDGPGVNAKPLFEEPVAIALSVADAVFIGREMRLQHKSTFRDPLDPKKSLPKPARPTRCELCVAKSASGETSVKGRGARATARAAAGSSGAKARCRSRCLHKFQTGCSERLAYLAKPQHRLVLCLLEEFSDKLKPHMVERLRDVIEGEVHFVPAQAYDYFVHVRKANKKAARMRRIQKRRDRQEIFQDKRYTWARDATVVFARGVQKRLIHPATYQLSGGMLRLSNIILDELCCYMRMRAPARCNPFAKPRFMIDLADKVAVWIDQILAESDERIALMDVDDDEDVMSMEPCDDIDILKAAVQKSNYSKTTIVFQSLKAHVYSNISMYCPSTENALSISGLESEPQYKRKEMVLTCQEFRRVDFPYEQWCRKYNSLEYILPCNTPQVCTTVSSLSNDSKFSCYASHDSEDNTVKSLKFSAPVPSLDIGQTSRGLSLPCLLMFKAANIPFATTEPSTSQYAVPSLTDLAPVESSADSQYFSISPRQSSCYLDWCFDRSNVSLVPPTSQYGAGTTPSQENPDSILDVTKFYEMKRPSEDCTHLTAECSRCEAKTAVVTAHQVMEWNSVTLRLLHNLQSWCLWIQESIERVTQLHNSGGVAAVATVTDWTLDEWIELKKCIAREALQWRQYNIFSEQLMWRVAARYKDKKIIPTSNVATKTDEYLAHQQDMLMIVDMLEKWSHWLTDIVQETSTLDEIDAEDFSQDSSYYQAMWSCFKRRVEQNAEHWRKYNFHLMQRWRENQPQVDKKI